MSPLLLQLKAHAQYFNHIIIVWLLLPLPIFQLIIIQMEAELPTLLQTLKGHKESIVALDLHPKCRFVASAGLDSTFLMWDIREKAPPRRYEGHKSHIQDLKFHPNGSLIASASSDGSIKFWEVENETKQVTITKAHNSKVRSIGYSCDGNLLVSAGDDKIVKVWSTNDRRLQGQYKKHENWVRSVEFSPISKNLISCDDRFVYIWDVATKKVLQQFKQHAGVIHQVKFHSLGNIAASCSYDRKIKLYDLRANQVVQVYEGHKGAVTTIDFHPHTCHLISSSEDGTTKIWNTHLNRLQYTIQSPSNVTKFSRQGDYFISAGVEKVINVWQTGFYDSYKEKIIGSPSLGEQGKGKVRCEIKQVSHQQTSEGDEKIGENKQENKGENSKRSEGQQVDVDLVYCHDKENFQSMNRVEKIEVKKSVIPVTLQRKLLHMSTQLDFITKTTQILEARVLNNGEQLRRLIDMVEMEGDLQPSN